MFCPNYKNREVFDGFNEMIEAFGGKPMTEEEFRSGELRNQRTGLDYQAMEATYRLYDLNGGNFLDLAPNGKPSLLFQSLLSQYNGDRAKAIVAKSEYYTKKYRNENEDWLNFSEIEASEYNKIQQYILKKTADKYDNVVDYLYTRFKKYFGTSIATDIVHYIYSNIDNGDYLKNEHIYDIIDFYLRNKLKDRVDHLINLHPNEGHVPIDAKSFIRQMIKLAKENKLTFNLNEDSKLLKLRTNNVYINTLLRYLFPDYYTYNFENKKSNKDILKRLHNKNIKYDNIIDHFNKTEIFNNLQRIKKLKQVKESLDKYLYKEKYIKLITNDILNYYKSKQSNENDNTNNVANRKTISWEDALESSSIISNAQSGTIVINSTEYKTYSMKAILNNIKNNSKRFSKLADLILQKVSGDFSVIFRSSNVENADQNVAVTWGAHASDGNYYQYISINQDNIDLFYIDPVKFFMHEAIHSVTVKLLKENDELSKQLLKYVEYVRQQLPLGIGKTGDYLMFDEYYGFKNEKEFIAEFFTNEDFQNELKHIKASDETTFKSFFDQILDFIIELFTNTANTIYDEIKPVMEKVLDMELDSTEYLDLLPHVQFIQHATENKLDINGEPVLENKSKVYNTAVDAVDIQFQKVGLNIQSDQTLQSLLNGEVISSRDLINYLISNNIFSGNNINLANILSRHDIQIRLGENMDISEVMSTIYDKKTKKSIILVNKNNLSRISNRYLGQTLLHELIHAVTLSAITNPSNEIESKFQSSNSNIFNLFNKLFKDYISEDLIPDEFYYAFQDESEFAAEFITNSTTRQTLYDIARQLDNGKGRILNSIKRYVNNIAKLLINKSIFNTAEQQLKNYENQFYDYLNGIQSNTEGMSESEIISALDNISNVDDYDSVIINLQTGKRITDRYVKQNKIVFGRNKVSSIPIHRLEEVSEMLNVRIDAIRTSNFDEAKKQQLTTLTQTQSEMFLNEEISKYIAITTFITSSKPQIIKDYDELRKAIEDAYIGQEVPNYIHQLHANFGMYKNIISTLQYIIEDPNQKQQIVDEYNDGLKSEEKIQLEDLDIIKSELDKIDRLVDSAIRILTKVRTNNALTVIHNVSEKVKNPEAKKYIEAVLEDDQVIDKDLNWLWQWVGSADSMQDEAVRTMSYLITDANQKTDKKTRIATVKLLNAAKRLKVGEKQSDIYETFEDGTPTQYLVRDLNFGRFYRDYDNFLFGYKNKKDVAYDILGRKYKKGKMVPGLNQIVSEKFNIKLKNDARVAPEGKDYEEARQFWNEKRNDWLDEHCHRKFNRKYYDAWNHVPFYLKQTLDNYTTRIQAILSLPGIVDEKGHKHLDLLSPELYNEYEDILIQRRLLYSPRDMYGNLKTGQDLEEYQILKKLRDTLYPKKKDPKTGEELPNEFKVDYESWEESRLRKAEQLKQKYGENSEEFKKKMLEWHRRNSRLVFKKGKNGAAIFERIDELVAEAIGKEVPDWGEEVKKKQDAIREIINSRKDEYGEPVPQMFYDQTVQKIIELQKEITQLKRKIVNENSELKAIRNTYNEIFEMYLEYVDTEYYAQMKEDMRKTISDEDVDTSDDMFDESFGGKFGYYTYSDDDEGSIFHPYKHLQKLQAIDINKWMEFVPNNSWIDTNEEDRVYINKDFDESYNSKMVPKRELYDNRKNFKKIKNSESLRNFYDAVLETLKESNSYQTNRMFVDNYRLPGITGSLYDRLKNNPFHRSFIIILQWIGEKLGLSKPQKDFVDFGMTQRQDDDGEILPETVRRDNIRKIIGAYPDGRSFNILPQFFTRKLDDTSLLSRDVVKIVSNYYRMSVAYSEKKKIQEQCETLLDFLKAKSVQSELQYSDDDKDNKNKSKKQEDSDLYKYAKRFLERSLYDVKINKTKIFGLEITRFSQSTKVYTTWRNLGLNPKVAITGFLTTLYVHILNSVIGEKYSISATVKAFGEMIKHVGSFVFGNTSLLGNLMPKNDVSTFAAEFGVADEAIRQLELTHFGNGIPGRILRTVKNSVYSFLTIGDYLNKCSIMLSVLNSYKYLDGEFITLFDLKTQRYKYSEKEFKDIVKRFKKAPTLRSMLKGNSGVIQFQSKSKDQHERELQKQAWENAYHTVKSRIQKWGQLADGMLTDEQKTYLQATTLGSFFLIHRSYIITYLNEWYGNTVYDYDTQQYKNGHFKFLLNFINQLQQNNLVLGTLSSAGAGAVLAGPLGASIGGAISIGRFVRSTYLRSKNNEQKSTVQEIFKKFFADYDNEISTKRSYHNKALAKQIFLETILYNLPFIGINALVNSICARYDDDDRWWVQVLLYGLRGFQWESYTHFRFGDLFNTVKNLSASISVVDKVEMFVNGLVRSIFPRAQAVNFNTLRDLKESVSGNMVGKRDKVYYGNTKLEKFFDELFPHSNLRKQIKDSRSRRHYFENQIMQLDKEERGY